MNIAIKLGCVLLLGTACNGLAAVERTPQALAWMSGCWSFEDKNGRHEEIWLAPAADHMPGLARGVNKGSTGDLEFLRISLIDGELYYLPQPWGEARPGFKLETLQGQRAVFVNETHDFPTRIIYEQPDAGRLIARIEGHIDGKPRGFDFPYRRSTCPQGIAPAAPAP